MIASRFVTECETVWTFWESVGLGILLLLAFSSVFIGIAILMWAEKRFDG